MESLCPLPRARSGPEVPGLRRELCRDGPGPAAGSGRPSPDLRKQTGRRMGSSRCVYSEVIYCGSSEVGPGDFNTFLLCCWVLSARAGCPAGAAGASEVSQVPGAGVRPGVTLGLSVQLLLLP